MKRSLLHMLIRTFYNIRAFDCLDFTVQVVAKYRKVLVFNLELVTDISFSHEYTIAIQ